MRWVPSILLALPFGLSVGCGPTSSSDADSGSDVVADASLLDGASLVADAANPNPDANPGTPSGVYAYYYGDFAAEGLDQVARVDLGNGASETLAVVGLSGDSEISSVAMSPDGQSLAVAGQNNSGDAPQLQLYPADGSGAPTVLFAAPDGQRRISSLSFSPDGDWIAFLADSELVGSRALHVVPIDASVGAKRVSLAPVSSSQDVAMFEWAPDSLQIAFLGDLVTNNVEALWTVNATAIAPTIIEIVTTAELGDSDVQRGLGFDATGRLFFRSDLVLGTGAQLFRVNVNGSGRIQVPGTALANDAGEATVGSFAISPDGNHVAFASESPSESLFQVYTLDLATMAPTLVSNLTTTAPVSGSAGPNLFDGMRWSPDATELVMAGDWPSPGGADNDFGVFVLPATGAPGGVRLAAPAVGSGDAFFPVFSADGAQVLFMGDMLVEGHNDLFIAQDLVTADQDLATLRAVQSIGTGSINGFVISPI